ncbi:NrfD/PsrC family molybdoenzyme membrane anchor subunit [Deltaproteobacteria bacterium TL4]
MSKNEFALKGIKDGLWVLTIAFFVVGFGRFAFGLAAATNMTDMMPWGLWKVFNMVAGAALATSGFVVAAIIYIFQLDKFRSVARFSILIGFLGYGSSLTALLFDIGSPHKGWHPFFLWNVHSFLFEVFWCVSVYWAITAIELLPIVTERLPFPKFTHFLHEKILPFVVLGVTLSTMHHSSLGSLFLATPTRLHPLWYSLWMPPEFFISAMGAGLSVIVLLYIIVSWLYKQERDLEVLGSLAKGSVFFLSLYFVLKVLDFTSNQKWDFVFGPELTWESYLFQIEMLLQVIIPVIVLSIPLCRKSIPGLLVGTSSAFFGLVLHRINTGIVGYFSSAESIYTPNLSEFVLSFGILAGAGLLFLLLVERFHIFKEPETSHDGHSSVSLWTKEEFKAVFAGAQAKRVTKIGMVVVPLTWFVFQGQSTGPFKPTPQPVNAAVIGSDLMRSELRIDANKNGDFVVFPHKKHQELFVKEYSLEQKETCVKCHHLTLPEDNNSNCRVCHKDMELDTAFFNYENHRQRFEAKEEYKKYLNLDLSSKKNNYKVCMDCHKDNMKGLESYAAKGFNPTSPGFKYAMHGSCQTCHRLRETEPSKQDSTGNCLFCHPIGKKSPNMLGLPGIKVETPEKTAASSTSAETMGIDEESSKGNESEADAKISGGEEPVNSPADEIKVDPSIKEAQHPTKDPSDQ